MVGVGKSSFKSNWLLAEAANLSIDGFFCGSFPHTLRAKILLHFPKTALKIYTKVGSGRPVMSPKTHPS